jgi:hypothetical protein
MPEAISVRHLGGFKLELEFSDGTIGIRDFAFICERTGSMVEPLKDPAYFARVFIEDGALTWPNGYDWDAIALHQEPPTRRSSSPSISVPCKSDAHGRE